MNRSHHRLWAIVACAAFLAGLELGKRPRPSVLPQACPQPSAEQQRQLRWPGIREGEKLAVYLKREGVMK